MVRIRGRRANTSCPHCGGELTVSTKVLAAPGSVLPMRRKLQAVGRKAEDAALDRLLRRLGQKPRRKVRKAKPKRKKVKITYEEPQPQKPKVKRQRRKPGTIGTMTPLVRSCGCKLTGRHKKTCSLATGKFVTPKRKGGSTARVYTSTEKPLPKGLRKVVEQDSREFAARKLANADKAEDGGRVRKLSPKGMAALAKLDPVRKPIKG